MKSKIKSMLISARDVTDAVSKWFDRMVALVRGALDYERQNPRVKRSREELEFLPAAVEILETPPSPFARVLLWTVCLLLLIAVIWSSVGKIDTHAVAEGRLEPVGKVKIIQSIIPGRVEHINVVEGEHVERGELLVLLDATEPEVDQQQVVTSLMLAQLNMVRNRILIESIGMEERDQWPDMRNWSEANGFAYAQMPTELQWVLQDKMLADDFRHFQSAQESRRKQIEQQQATVQAIESDIERLRELSPIYQEREEALSKMREAGASSRVDWLAAREKWIDITKQLEVQLSRKREAELALETLHSENNRALKEYCQEHRQREFEHYDRVVELERTLVKATEREKNCHITAPASGTIQQLQLISKGDVVEPARILMHLIPDNEPLRVEALVENRDIGFVFPGQDSDIKIESFPYTHYGSLSGKVVEVAKRPTDSEDQHNLYPVYIEIDRQLVSVNGQMQPLQVGMAVTADIRIGERTLLEYFMAPLLRYKNETLDER